MIKLLVIDDHPVTILGLQNYLGNSIKIIFSSSTIKDSLNFDINQFDIILLDLYIEGTTPFDNVDILKKIYPNKPIVIFTSEESSIWKKKMYQLGVQSYISKTSSKNQILFALEMIMKNI